ncbi:Flavocytochrome c [Bisporella sp. PMI_857]|nr:Flavocytochrome c [Bisporella sp. PMI_857]
MATPLTRHAIVVGSGLAGLSAASQLIANNIPVYLLERSVKPGGNSIKASSGINGAPTKYQPFPDLAFYGDTVKSVGGIISTATERREGLIKTLTDQSASAINWLVDEKGVDLSVVAQLGGHSLPRTHRGAGKLPPGAAIVSTLLKTLKESPDFHLETESIVTRVIKENDVVDGVEYTLKSEPKVLRGPVIFASGGFGGDAKGMMSQYRPDLAAYPSTNDARPGSQNLLTSVGAQLLDMEHVQVHPTSFVDPQDVLNPVNFLAAEILRGEGGILLFDGKRFVNEMGMRKDVTEAVTQLPAEDDLPKQWHVQIVLDAGVHKKAATHVDFYLWKGLMRMTTVGELAERFPQTAEKTIREYCDVVAGRKEDPFGRKTYGSWETHEVTMDTIIYVGRVTPAIHFTMGGVVINEQSQILDADEKPIKGLWAAGEVTGGIHGENRLGGSSLLECVVFGRIAGDQVSEMFRVS